MRKAAAELKREAGQNGAARYAHGIGMIRSRPQIGYPMCAGRSKGKVVGASKGNVQL